MVRKIKNVSFWKNLPVMEVNMHGWGFRWCFKAYSGEARKEEAPRSVPRVELKVELAYCTQRYAAEVHWHRCISAL